MKKNKIDFMSFMTNDDDPDLCRMADQLLNMPEFKSIIEQKENKKASKSENLIPKK